MRFGIIIPAHNEGKFLSLTLDSLLAQTYLPYQIIIIDDNSSDNTQEVLSFYCQNYPNIQSNYRNSSISRLPGAKVVQAFNSGLSMLEEVDIICKFDADLIFPSNYLETLNNYFINNPKIGICGGVCSIEKKGEWVLESLTNKNHLRGALKSYRKSCFQAIGGLKEAMGWDTVDELLALYYQWEVKVDDSLIVKHLRPTASAYNKQSQYMQGEMFYRLRYGFFLSFLASLKLSYKKRKFSLFIDYMIGYFRGKKLNNPFLVTEEEGEWIRSYRKKMILKKILLKK